MMKKNGFTLAEVLITLAIIGVVASITLPALMGNVQEQQAVTAFRKSMNTLNEVAQLNAAQDGFDFTGVSLATQPAAGDVYDANGRLDQSVWGMMYSKAQVDVTKSGAAGEASAISPGGTGNGSCANMDFVIAFRDGTALCYANTHPAANGENHNDPIFAVVDTNGIKAPNRVSVCAADDRACINRSTRNIGDQFVITLHKGIAIPGRVTPTDNGGYTDTEGFAAENNAARWAMSK